ncbi:hypothetical protein PPL_00959 [Heterostelium album PN500]|uniref:B box-type domain-containing protein n=1 Tax=Heterostelium pallidum (strain ATCC 26659 / Pp 5 / PN500) TaxID=670386 RepID=D3AXQ2_HETP5|nr:hypothetical protein PPL_00959 [Heterostelium album PN500]EFA85729.1 hypothetical protein PPL_00959 [Heterostelium album PN500]|eukprot:XP_020437835.1 hypothetical protein PPL_00959 [Heterostelium album PN500]
MKINDDFNFNCHQHSKKLKFICTTCNEILCLDCIPEYKHKSHIFDDIDSIKNKLYQQIHQQNQPIFLYQYEITNSNDQLNNKPTYNFINRLAEIWKYLKELSLKHQLFEDTGAVVNEFYRNLHEYLRLEEFKIMKPITDEKNKAESIIESLVEEIKSINSILIALNSNPKENSSNCHCTGSIPSSGMNGKGDKKGYMDVVNYQLSSIINKIKSCTSINQFLLSNQSTIFAPVDPVCDNPTYDTLLKIRTHQTIFPLEYQEPISYQIRFDELKLESIKKELQTLYELVNLNDDIDRSSGNMIITIGNDGANLFDISSEVWIDLEPDTEHRFATLNSIVQVGQHCYVFGGGDKSTTFSRYSIVDHKWDYHGEILGSAGEHVAACYDGNKYIYVYGGFINLKHLSRLARLDIETMRWEKIGDNDYASTCAYIFYYENSIYIVGGDCFKTHHRTVMKCDLETLQFSTFINDIGFSTHTNSVCYGDGYIYILDADSTFYRISIVDKNRTTLKSPFSQFVPYKSAMVYVTDNMGSHIYFISGSQYGNHHYSIQNDSWLKINDKDTINRCCIGAALIKNVAK